MWRKRASSVTSSINNRGNKKEARLRTQKQISNFKRRAVETQTERGKATDSEKLCRSRQAERNILSAEGPCETPSSRP